jgi:hypothetical protein
VIARALLALACLAGSPALASGDSFPFPLPSGAVYSLSLVREEYQARLDVREKDKLVQYFSHMGNDFLPLANGKKWQVAKVDGKSALLLHTEFAPFIGAAWVFRFEEKDGALGLLSFGAHGRYLPVPLKSRLGFNAKGEIEVKTAGGASVFTMRWNGKAWDRR